MKLSICIPTYNRKNYLVDLLVNIASCTCADDSKLIEVCISDNASTDGTEEAIAEIKNKYNLNIKYSKNSTNIGADKNYLKVVTLASGEYCWFMGSDDLLVSNATDSILQILKSNCGIYLIDRILCDVNMKEIFRQHWIATKSSEIFEFKNEKQFVEYFNKVDSLGGAFSYLSSIIFKRKDWSEVWQDPDFIGSAYCHVQILMQMLLNGASMKYEAIHIVKCRTGNDAFAVNGAVSRFLIDVDGYFLVWNKVFNNMPNAGKSMLKILTREHGLLRLAKICSLVDNDEWKKIKRKLLSAGFANYKIFLSEFLSIFVPIRAWLDMNTR